jgi:UDP-N-acetyl-D-mannosaminuronic acid transferase (WecB/TagA/CpsF family)
MTKVNLGSLNVDALSQEEVVTQIKSKILKSLEPNILVTPNAGHLTNIFSNPELSEIYSTAELSLIDGWPIALAAKNASKLEITRVTGSDLLPELFTQLTKDVRVGIFGGNNESLIRQSLESRFKLLIQVSGQFLYTIFEDYEN